jgi:hypothetical protein
MKTFKSLSDVEQLAHEHPAYSTVKNLVVQGLDIYTELEQPYNPDFDGYAALVESQDVDRVLDDLLIPYRLDQVPWEGVSMLEDYFYAVYLANNQFGIGFLIPDAAWVTGKLRQSLEDNLDP